MSFENLIRWSVSLLNDWPEQDKLNADNEKCVRIANCRISGHPHISHLHANDKHFWTRNALEIVWE